MPPFRVPSKPPQQVCAAIIVLALLGPALLAALPHSHPQAQQTPTAVREIRVGLGWQVLPREVTAKPRAAGSPGATFRACAACPAQQLVTPVTLTVQGDALRATGVGAASREFFLEGDYDLLLPSRPAVHSHFPATLRARDGGIRVVLRVPLPDYVNLALAGESAVFSSENALKAMAVVVRTYAVSASAAGRHAGEDFDVCDSTHCQLLRFDDAAPARLAAAAAATEGELLWYRGEPASTFYSRNCAGTTEDAARVFPGISAPYLRSHADPYCVLHGRNEWSAEISKTDLAAALRQAGIAGAGASVESLRVVERTPSGRVSRIEVRGSAAQAMTGERFRVAVARVMGAGGLRSNSFEVSDAGDHFIFHGYGAGHGAGLCQAGADEMGAEGKTYREILAFYYPGTTVAPSARDLDWVQVGGERLDVLTTRPDVDRALVERAERLLREAEERAGWQLAVRPQVRVYPSVSVYRNATGEPGWVAASTRGRTVRIEPPEVLGAALDATLRHEFLHLLIENRARPGLPLWFREGLALYLNGDGAADGGESGSSMSPAALDHALASANSADALRAAYREARAAVARLVNERGKAEVLSWIERGVPQ